MNTTMTEARRADSGVQERTCGYGRCVKDHPLHCCHTAVTVRIPLARTVEEMGWRCVFCKKESHTWTAIQIDQHGEYVPPEEE